MLEISFSFQWLKNFENRLRFDEVTAISLVASFYVDTMFNAQAHYFLYRFNFPLCTSQYELQVSCKKSASFELYSRFIEHIFLIFVIDVLLCFCQRCYLLLFFHAR